MQYTLMTMADHLSPYRRIVSVWRDFGLWQWPTVLFCDDTALHTLVGLRSKVYAKERLGKNGIGKNKGGSH